MPRRPRVHVPGGYYHVTLRGNHRQAIFRTDADRAALDELVEESLQRFEAHAHAYCWMTNHIHFLAQVGDAPLGHIMHRIASRYARAFQRSIPTTGHLFERRYHALLVEADSHLIASVRYIHMNPVRAGLVTDPSEYPWSSHAAYLGRRGPPWLTTGSILRMLHADEGMARRAYLTLMQEELCAPDGVSRDGWRDCPTGVTPRDLGPARGDRHHPTPRSLDALIATACRRAGIDADLLASRSRSQRLCALRAAIAAEAVHARLATLSEIALRFDRNVASVSRLLSRRGRRDSGAGR